MSWKNMIEETAWAYLLAMKHSFKWSVYLFGEALNSEVSLYLDSFPITIYLPATRLHCVQSST